MASGNWHALFRQDDDDPRRRARRPLLVFLLATLAVGGAASVFTEPAIPTWYAGLNRPALAPPNWVFAPVWTTLYILMAVAAWRVWKAQARSDGRRGITMEMAAYAIQLALNFAWSALFFAAHRIGAALAESMLLWLAILVTTVLFFRRDRLAGLLFLLYLAWAGFAVALTQAFWAANP